MKELLVFIRKEFYHVFRDKKTLLLLFGMPVVQILLFGFALTNEIKNSDIIVCDYARDAASQHIIGKLRASTSFNVESSIMSYKQIEASFKKGTIKMAVVLPNNLFYDLSHNNTGTIQVIADASDPNTATTLSSNINNIIQSYQAELNEGVKPPLNIVPEVRMIYNPELKGSINFVPGVMALVLLLICVLMTSVSIVKEKETGTMEVLLVSPFSPVLVIIAKALPYLLLSLVNLAVILQLSVYLLDVPVAGSLLILVTISTLFIVTSLSLGLLISNATATQQSAMLISLMGLLLPTMIFTGFMFPIENMPRPLQLFSNLVPSKWFYIIVKDVMIKGLGWGAIWKETLILIGMTAVLLFISIKQFKIRLS